MRRRGWPVALAVGCVLALALVGARAKPESPPVVLELYARALCPFALQMEQDLTGTARLLGDRVRIRVEYMVMRGPDGEVISPAGELEVSRLKLCAQHLASTQLQALSFFSCVNKSWQTIPETWPSCARDVGLDADELQACSAGPLGASLLAASSERSEALGSPVSPTLFLNDALYTGGRARPFLVQAACRALADGAPPACRALPEPAPVDAVLLTDASCERCDVQPQLAEVEHAVFPTMRTITIDSRSPTGREIVATFDLRSLPALLFDPAVASAAGFPFFSQLMRPLPGGWYLWPLPAKIPTQPDGYFTPPFGRSLGVRSPFFQ
jgi:hypothetical protein